MDGFNFLKRVDPLLAGTSQQQQIMNLCSPEAELLDPTPDLHAMFQLFGFQFFDGKLGRCTVEWSKRMKNCAGICYYQPGTGLCTIRMSEPLLKLRPRKDFVETLLHEMIHAYLFVTERNTDRDGHGPHFQAHMNRINRLAGTAITIYHSFHAEVAVYKQHWWRCDGQCRSRPPYYGYVKRSMNRAPSANDFWWSIHQATCNGTFIKIKEPAKAETRDKVKQIGSSSISGKTTSSLVKGITATATSSKASTPDSSSSNTPSPPISNCFVQCPSCVLWITTSQLNSHLDTCLSI